MITALGTLIGGIGLFLIGMMHLTDGLKQSAGEKLEYYLNRWTNTKKRAFFSGFTLTSLVQSSSVITVATIGFVNANLLKMSQAVWVVFGSNVGTTMTAWIVALIGFKFKVELFALPLVGIGAFLHILSRSPQWRALGGAIAGFGLLFVGLDLLQGSLEAYKGSFEILGARDFDVLHVFLLLGIGFLMTLVMQSSSASMAMILTFVNAGVVPLALGAAAVIGANIGTTSTAVLATVGATPNAKRVAWAHVSFNIVAGVGALIFLPLVSEVFTDAYDKKLMGGNAAFWLAVYHSLFNLFGVLLMIPFEPRITRFLKGRFHRKEEEPLRLRYLDKTIVNMPPIALQSVINELKYLIQLTTTMMLRSRQDPNLKDELQKLIELLKQFDDFVVLVLRQPMSDADALAFTKAIRCSQGMVNAIQLFKHLDEEDGQIKDQVLTQMLSQTELKFNTYLESFQGNNDLHTIHDQMRQFNTHIDNQTGIVFKIIKTRNITGNDVDLTIQRLAQRKRIAKQIMKNIQRLEDINTEAVEVDDESPNDELQTLTD